MKTQDIRNMGLAYLEVLEGKDSAARRAQKAAWDAEDNAVLAKAHAVNKHGHDHVGQEDDDVNNDKKTDSTDKYLLNRRKAISANVRKEEVEELDELSTKTTDSYWKKATKQLDDPKLDPKTHNKRVSGVLTALNRDSKKNRTEEVELDEAQSMKDALKNSLAKPEPGSKLDNMIKSHNRAIKGGATIGSDHPDLMSKAPSGHRFNKKGMVTLGEEIELDEISANTLGKYSIKAAQQRGSDKRVAGQKMADEKIRKKYGYSSNAKVAAEATEWPIFARIQEKLTLPSYKVSGIGDDPHEVTVKYATDPHTKGATAPEKMDSKLSQGEKDFIAMHGGLDGNESGINAREYTAKNAIAHTSNVKVAPGRHNDQKIGDKAPLKSKS